MKGKKGLSVKLKTQSFFLNHYMLKGHGNEADFLGFFQKSVHHESLTLPFEPFRFSLLICGDLHNPIVIGKSGSWRVADSPTHHHDSPGVGMVSRGGAVRNYFNLSSIFLTLNG